MPTFLTIALRFTSSFLFTYWARCEALTCSFPSEQVFSFALEQELLLCFWKTLSSMVFVGGQMI